MTSHTVRLMFHYRREHKIIYAQSPEGLTFQRYNRCVWYNTTTRRPVDDPDLVNQLEDGFDRWQSAHATTPRPHQNGYVRRPSHVQERTIFRTPRESRSGKEDRHG